MVRTVLLQRLSRLLGLLLRVLDAIDPAPTLYGVRVEQFVYLQVREACKAREVVSPGCGGARCKRCVLTGSFCMRALACTCFGVLYTKGVRRGAVSHVHDLAEACDIDATVSVEVGRGEHAAPCLGCEHLVIVVQSLHAIVSS